MAEPMKEKEDLQDVVQETVETVLEPVEEIKEETLVEKSAEVIETQETPEKKSTGMTDANLYVTKVEGFVMFFIMLFMMILCTLTLNKTIVSVADEQSGEMHHLKSEIAALESKVSSLEDKLKGLDPENLDININVGKDQVEFTYDTETNQLVPVEPIDEHMEEVEMGFDERPFLGVAFNSEESTNPFGLKIDYIYEYSPAEEAGLKVGDIIININGIKINQFSDLDAVISSLSAGEEVEIEVATATENGIDCVKKTAILSYRGNFVLE